MLAGAFLSAAATAAPTDAAQRQSGRWTRLKGVDRTYHTATKLEDGRILVAGGCTRFDPSDAAHGICSEATSSSILYDPSSGESQGTGAMRRKRAGASATPLADGRVLVMGGEVIQGRLGFLEGSFSAETYDPETGKWSLAGSAEPFEGEFPLSAFGGSVGGKPKSGRMVRLVTPQALFAPTAVRLPSGPEDKCGKACGHVLVIGRSRADLFDPRSGRWRLLAQEQGLTHSYARTATVLDSGKVLIVGAVQDHSALFDPATEEFKQIPNLEVPRILHTASLLPGGRVLIAGGFRGGDVTKPTDSAEIFSPAASGVESSGSDGSWRPARSMGTPRFAHTATSLGNGKVLVAGGSEKPDQRLLPKGLSMGETDRPGRTLRTAELYDPSTGRWTPAGEMSASRRSPVFGLALTAIQPSASGATTFTATRLDDGRVIVLGGGSKAADVYVPTGLRPAGAEGSKFVAPVAIAAALLIPLAGFWWIWRRRRRDPGAQGAPVETPAPRSGR